MAREGSGDGEADRFLHESEASDVSETIENMEREVKKELTVRVKNCSTLLRPGRKAAVGIVPKQVPGINRLTKTPRKLKASRAEMRRRHENPTPKVRHQKKSTGGAGYYHRIRNTPNPEERSSCQEKMAGIVGRHQTKGNILGKTWYHRLA